MMISLDGYQDKPITQKIKTKRLVKYHSQQIRD